MGLRGQSCHQGMCAADELMDQYQGILAGFSVVLNLCLLRETRGDVLLSRRARRLTKTTGRKHCCASDLQRKSVVSILRVSLVRPFGRRPLTRWRNSR